MVSLEMMELRLEVEDEFGLKIKIPTESPADIKLSKTYWIYFWLNNRIMLATVAITGSEIISPIGNRTSTAWRNLLNNYSEISELSEAWFTTLKTELVSRCKQVSIELEPLVLKRFDR